MKAKNSFSKNAITFIALSAVLLCGVIVGSVTASFIESDTAYKLSTSISSSASAGINDTARFLPTTLLNLLKYPLIAFLLGFTLLGIGLIPLVVGLRGYFLAFSIGVVIKLYGLDGIWLSVALWGLQCLVSIPCLLLISVQSFNCARAQMQLFTGGKRVIIGSVFTKAHFVFFGICILVLILFSFIEVFITPKLINFAFTNI